MKNQNWLNRMGKPGYFLLLLAIPILSLTIKNIGRKNEKQYIKTVTAKYDVLVSTITSIGTVVPKTKMSIAAELTGMIEEVFVEDGGMVEKGQQLLKINSSLQHEKYLLTKKEVIQTQLEVERVQKELQRSESLYKLNQISEKELDELKRKLSALRHVRTITQQLLALHQTKTEKTIIRAPMAGMILFSWPLEKGISVNSGQHLLSVVGADGVNIETYLNEDDAVKVKVGQEAFIKNHLLAADSTLLKGTISFIAPEIKRGLVKVIVHADDNFHMRLGSSVEVKIHLSALDRALVLPVEAVRIFEEKTYVFTIETGVVKKRQVVIGNNNHQFVEIISGDKVVEGIKVIVSHFDEISEGMEMELHEDR